MSNTAITIEDEFRKEIRGARVFGKGQYFEPGQYLLEVSNAFYQRTLKNGTASENIIVEFTVLQSSNANIEVGSTRSSVFAFKHDGWLDRFKSLVVALMGHHPSPNLSKETEAQVEDVYVALRSSQFRAEHKLPDNFLKGIRIQAEGFPGTSRRGGPITNMKWSPYTEAT